jgi:hypothetical protein
MTTYTDDVCETVALAVQLGTTWAESEAKLPGIQAAVRRYQAKLRKRNSRASAEKRIELPLPAGTAAALRRVCEATGDEPVALLSQQIHMLDRVLVADAGLFAKLTRYDTDVTDVAARYAHLVGGDNDE